MRISTSWMLCWVAASLAVCGCAGMRPTRDIALTQTAAESSATTDRAVARLCERRGEAEQAKQMYAMFLKHNPRDAEAHHRLAIIACKEEHFERAEEHFRAALAVAPHHPLILGDFGYALYLQGRLPEAEEYLTKALESDPQLTSAQNNLGLVLGQQRRYAESLAMFRRSGSESEAFANLAFVHARQGNLEPAEALYSQALTANNKLRPAAHGLMQVAQRKQMLQVQGQQTDARVIAQATQNSPAPAPAGTQTEVAENAPVAEYVPQGRTQPPQFVMAESPATTSALPTLADNALSETAAQPGRRFVADEFVELVDAPEPKDRLQRLPSNAALPGNAARTRAQRDPLISTAVNSHGTPARFASTSPSQEVVVERLQPDVVQEASHVLPIATPAVPRHHTPVAPTIEAESSPRLQMRYVEGVKLKTLETPAAAVEVQPESSVEAPAAIETSPLVLKVVAPQSSGTSVADDQPAEPQPIEAPAEPAKPLLDDQLLPRTVFHLGPRQPAGKDVERQGATTVDRPAENATPAPPFTSYSTPRMHWNGPNAPRYSSTPIDSTRRPNDEFRVAPQRVNAETSATLRVVR